MGEHGIEREYRYRRRPPGRWFAVLGIVAASGTFRLTTTDLGAWLWGPFAAVIASLSLYMALFFRRAVTFVRAEGITAQGAVHRRTWSWHDIYDIRVEAPGSNYASPSPRCIAYLYGTDGRKFILPHLNDWQLHAPHTEVAALRAAARDHGARWDRRPEVEARIRRRAGHRKAWEHATMGALIVLLCMLVVLLVLITLVDEPPVLLLLAWIPLASFALLAALLNWQWETQVPPSLREP